MLSSRQSSAARLDRRFELLLFSVRELFDDDDDDVVVPDGLGILPRFLRLARGVVLLGVVDTLFVADRLRSLGTSNLLTVCFSYCRNLLDGDSISESFEDE